MLRFYLVTARNIAVGMAAVLTPFLVARTAQWLFGVVPLVSLLDKLVGTVAIVIGTSMLGSAIWTGAQWIQGRSFSN